MTEQEATKVAKILDHNTVTAQVVKDELGAKVVIMIEAGPGNPYRLTLEDVGWTIEQGKRLVAWSPIE